MRMMLLTNGAILSRNYEGGRIVEYEHGPDSVRQPDVPRGMVTKHVWKSQFFLEGETTRDYWLYVPAQYDSQTPMGLMVFQDGHAYIDESGPFRVPIVFDNLIHKKTIPPLIGLFINPGHHSDGPSPENPWRASFRSYEYDMLSDEYARFLIEEMIPEIGKTYNLAENPKMRAICGLSSGGICAFTAAWERPDHFHKVMSHTGSFVDVRGGHVYPSLIRKSAKRDIRVFLQDGSNDLDMHWGNWWLSNLQMESSLKFRGYDHKFVGGTGGHDGEHGGAILPESLEWLWR
ncbi:MAG: esterase family protein [Proteobacteria bacterium]|nr:esterase family protein [Pseudomonadota bacterium]